MDGLQAHIRIMDATDEPVLDELCAMCSVLLHFPYIILCVNKRNQILMFG